MAEHGTARSGDDSQPGGKETDINEQHFDSNAIGLFLSTLFGSDDGYAVLWFGYDGHIAGNEYVFTDHKENFYHWPTQRDRLLSDIANEIDSGRRVDCYFCPALRNSKERAKGNAVSLRCLTADADGQRDVSALLATLGAIRVTSGTPRHEHVYLGLAEPVDAATFETLQRALKQKLGTTAALADNTLLRLPFTYNHKPDGGPVELLPGNHWTWSADALAGTLGADLTVHTPEITTRPYSGLTPRPEPMPAEIPPYVAAAFKQTAPVGKRSDRLLRLVSRCVTARWTPGQTLTLANRYQPAVDKYGDRLPDQVGHLHELAVADDFTLFGQKWAPLSSDLAHTNGNGNDQPAIVDVGVSGLLDWYRVWAETKDDADWIVPDFLERGRSHAFYAPKKVGKSLSLLIGAVIGLVTNTDIFGQPNPHGRRLTVLYIDQENSPTDIRQRIEAAGFGPDDLDHLCYYSFSDIADLDTAEGGRQLMSQVDKHSPDLVVIDTTSRVVAGKENASDTYRELYRHSFVPLKRAGITVCRIDHAGKDLTQGQRGSSAKGDDVDTIWRLDRKGTKFTLTLEAQRSGHHPEYIPLEMTRWPLLRFNRTDGASEIDKIITKMDNLMISVDLGGDKVREHLVRADPSFKASNLDLGAAIKARKNLSGKVRTDLVRDDQAEIDYSCPQDQDSDQ